MRAVDYNLTPRRVKGTLKDSKDKEFNENLSKFLETGANFKGEFDFGDDVNDAIAKYGDKVVFTHWRLSAGLWLGGRVRDILEAGLGAGKALKKVVEEIQAKINAGELKPGVVIRQPKKSSKEVYLEEVGGMGEEEKLAEIAKMEELLTELKG